MSRHIWKSTLLHWQDGGERNKLLLISVFGYKHSTNEPLPSLSCSESDDMVFEEFKRAYLKGIVYGDDDESPTEA